MSTRPNMWLCSVFSSLHCHGFASYFHELLFIARKCWGAWFFVGHLFSIRVDGCLKYSFFADFGDHFWWVSDLYQGCAIAQVQRSNQSYVWSIPLFCFSSVATHKLAIAFSSIRESHGCKKKTILSKFLETTDQYKTLGCLGLPIFWSEIPIFWVEVRTTDRPNSERKHHAMCQVSQHGRRRGLRGRELTHETYAVCWFLFSGIRLYQPYQKKQPGWYSWLQQ